MVVLGMDTDLDTALFCMMVFIHHFIPDTTVTTAHTTMDITLTDTERTIILIIMDTAALHREEAQGQTVFTTAAQERQLQTVLELQLQREIRIRYINKEEQIPGTAPFTDSKIRILTEIIPMAASGVEEWIPVQCAPAALTVVVV